MTTAAYLTLDPANADYEAVTHAGVKLEGVMFVSRDHAGELHVEEEDHPARKDAEIPRSSADGVDGAVTNALKKTVGEADGKKLHTLKKAPAEAQEEMKQPAE